MEEFTVKTRLREFIMSLGISGNAFEKEVGLNKGYVANKTTKPSADILQKIHDRYPELNINWLLFGEGTMINVDVIEERKEHFEAMNAMYDDCEIKKDKIKELTYALKYTGSDNIEVYTDDALHYELDKVKALLKEKTDALAFITKEFTEMTSERNDYKEKFLEAQSKYIALLEKMSEGNIDSLSHTA